MRNAGAAVGKLKNRKLANQLSVVPNEPLPPIGTLGFRVQRYGMSEWGHLYTERQMLASRDPLCADR